jgi:hypothetical protein
MHAPPGGDPAPSCAVHQDLRNDRHAEDREADGPLAMM